MINHSHIAQADLHGLTYGKMNRLQRERATLLVLTAFFNNVDRSPARISTMTRLDERAVKHILDKNITEGVNLVELKSIYKNPTKS